MRILPHPAVLIESTIREEIPSAYGLMESITRMVAGSTSTGPKSPDWQSGQWPKTSIESLRGRADALYVATDPLILANRDEINALSQDQHLPTIFGREEYVKAGGFMSYGANCSGGPLN